MADFPIKMVDLPIKNGGFTDLPIKNGDFLYMLQYQRVSDA